MADTCALVTNSCVWTPDGSSVYCEIRRRDPNTGMTYIKFMTYDEIQANKEKLKKLGYQTEDLEISPAQVNGYSNPLFVEQKHIA